jgi:PAS domain S-box-containing protein
LGLPESEDHFPEINLFKNFIIPFKKEKLLKEKSFKFQTKFNIKKIDNKSDNSKYLKSAFFEGTVSVINSGFLVQIQHIPPDGKSGELIQRERKYRRFFEDDLTGDFIATPEGRILECNPSFAELYGFQNIEEASKSNMSQFNSEDWENLAKRLETEYKIKSHQTIHKRHDGKQIHVVCNVVAIFNESGQLDQIEGYIFDDTERKEAENALRESEKKYRRLFDEDLTGDFIAKPDGKILECNPAFAVIYGFNTIENALTWNISESNPFDWPYMVTRLKSEGKIQGFQSWQRRSDAMRIHVVANLVGIFNDGGKLTHVKGYVFDDTERKKAEEGLDRTISQITGILNSIKDGFVALNNLWEIVYVNHCAAEYAGVDADDLLGQNIWRRFPELVGTIYETTFRKAMGSNDIQNFEARGFAKTDSWFDFSVYPSEDGISIYWRDITQRKKL